MSWPSSRERSVSELERLLHHAEALLAQLNRSTNRTSQDAPRTVDRIAARIVAALGDVSDRFGSGARTAGRETSHLADEAFTAGNDALRKLTREVEQRPLVTLGVAFGLGLLAAGLLARRP